jgi:hypothetical protein
MYFNIALLFISITYLSAIALIINSLPFEYLGLVFFINGVFLLATFNLFSRILFFASNFDKPNTLIEDEHLTELKSGCGVDCDASSADTQHLRIRESREVQDRKKPV